MKECDHVWKARIDKKNNYIFYFCVKCKESNKPSMGRHLCKSRLGNLERKLVDSIITKSQQQHQARKSWP